MNRRVVASASALAVATVLAGVASAAPAGARSLAFTDYTPDPATLAASEALYVGTGLLAKSYCNGRIPAIAQDVNAHRLVVTAPAVLQLHLSATGAWGMEVDNRQGKALAGLATDRTPTTPADLKVRLRPGTYSVTACNLGGAPSANATYQLTRAH